MNWVGGVNKFWSPEACIIKYTEWRRNRRISPSVSLSLKRIIVNIRGYFLLLLVRIVGNVVFDQDKGGFNGLFQKWAYCFAVLWLMLFYIFWELSTKNLTVFIFKFSKWWMWWVAKKSLPKTVSFLDFKCITNIFFIQKKMDLYWEYEKHRSISGKKVILLSIL